MARMDLRARAFAWLTRRQGSVAGMTDEQVIALQKREMPDSKVTNWIFGTVPPGVNDAEVFWRARAGSFHADAKFDWLEAYEGKLKTAIRWRAPGQEAAE